MNLNCHFSSPHKLGANTGGFSSNANFSSRHLSFGGSSNVSPFITPAPNSNPKFTPVSKTGPSKSTYATIDLPTAAPLKPPKPPEKPLTPYMRYSKKVWEKARASNPESKMWDIGKVVGSMWRELPDKDKQIFFDEYEAEKLEYDKAVKIYKHSPAYLAYEQQLQRNKGKADKANRLQSSNDSGVYIQAVDEDDGDDNLSMAHVASARFQRNQKLLMELFSTPCVPDLRNVVHIQKVMHVRRQIRSLSSHQKNLENELETIETSFQAKKRALETASNNFVAKWKKISEEAKVIDEQQFEEMVARDEQRILKAYAEYKNRQQIEKRIILGEQNNTTLNDDVRIILESVLERVTKNIANNL